MEPATTHTETWESSGEQHMLYTVHGSARPTDAEIVEAWEGHMLELERQVLGPVPDSIVFKQGPCAGHEVTRALYVECRSQVLTRKQEEAREKERRAVVCEGTLAEDY